MKQPSFFRLTRKEGSGVEGSAACLELRTVTADSVGWGWVESALP